MELAQLQPVNPPELLFQLQVTPLPRLDFEVPVKEVPLLFVYCAETVSEMVKPGREVGFAGPDVAARSI